jgi:hypothetical protein
MNDPKTLADILTDSARLRRQSAHLVKRSADLKAMVGSRDRTACDLRISIYGYSVKRHGADHEGFRYDVWRPDGSFCCHEVIWRGVEDRVVADLDKLPVALPSQ